MKPIETILGLSRVRLAQRIPIVEATELLELRPDEPGFWRSILKPAEILTEKSYLQFSSDELSLTLLERAVLSRKFLVTNSARMSLGRLVNDVCGDELIYKRFRKVLTPLFEISDDLEEAALAAGIKASSAQRKAIDLANCVGLQIWPVA
ncbi:MAG: hypothetical protein QXT81_01320 [Candidatus Bathyarchaeia archaeon]